jgi:hypothetical protein
MISDILFSYGYFIFETSLVVGGSLTNASFDGDNYDVRESEIITIVTF